MKHRVFLIAALSACMLSVFAAFAQGGIQTADFKLTYPANPASGAFFFRSRTGNWNGKQ